MMSLHLCRGMGGAVDASLPASVFETIRQSVDTGQIIYTTRPAALFRHFDPSTPATSLASHHFFPAISGQRFLQCLKLETVRSIDLTATNICKLSTTEGLDNG